MAFILQRNRSEQKSTPHTGPIIRKPLPILAEMVILKGKKVVGLEGLEPPTKRL